MTRMAAIAATAAEAVRPWNPANKLIDWCAAEEILQRCGFPATYRIRHLANFQAALTHPSYSVNADGRYIIAKKAVPLADGGVAPAGMVPLQRTNFEILEHLGDADVYSLTTHCLLDIMEPPYTVFDLSTIRSRVVRNAHLAELARKMGLGEWVLLAAGLEKKRDSIDVLSDVFEAWVGAIHAECGDGNHMEGIALANTFLRNVYDKFIDWDVMVNVDDNYVDQFLAALRAREGGVPTTWITYSTTELTDSRPGGDRRSTEGGDRRSTEGGDRRSTSGPRGYRITAAVRGRDGRVIATGYGRSKSDARKYACQAALKKLGMTTSL